MESAQLQSLSTEHRANRHRCLLLWDVFWQIEQDEYNDRIQWHGRKYSA